MIVNWDILLNADEDLPRFEEILDSLHPSIKWTLNVSDPENFHALEFLDLTILIIDGKIETDLFAKDVPIFLPKNSCHPHTFSPPLLNLLDIGSMSTAQWISSWNKEKLNTAAICMQAFIPQKWLKRF